MTLLNAVILGIVQGLAEFLPISSSGHLAILQEILNIKNAGMVFDVMLHLGTLIAIFFAFWRDISKMIVEGILIIRDAFINVGRLVYNAGHKDNYRKYIKVIGTPYRKFVMLVIVSTIPTGIIGVLFKDIVETAATSLIITGICLIITGILLIIADMTPSGRKRPLSVKYREAGVIGVVQGLATLPGISRSGSTITACLLCGFDKNFAVKYSFIMSIPAVLGAVVLELKDFTTLDISASEMTNYGIGTFIAAVVGYICIKTMLIVVRGKKFKYFAYYCFVVGMFAIIWYLA